VRPMSREGESGRGDSGRELRWPGTPSAVRGVITLVTFDFWQTLFADTPEGLSRAHPLRLASVGTALARAGHAYDAATLAAADTRALAALEAIWGQHRDVSPAEQVRVFLDVLDPALPGRLAAADRGAIETAYAGAALAHPPVVAPGAVEAIHDLAARGLTLAVISNIGRTPGTILRRLLAGVGILERFPVLSFSDEVGLRKPAAGIFVRTLAGAGAPPAAAVHVGDDPVNDVAGARAVGMRALHYVSDGQPASPDADGTLRHFADLPALVARLI
jgi:putative hydrolase of the HAD superfamily